MITKSKEVIHSCDVQRKKVKKNKDNYMIETEMTIIKFKKI